MSRAAPHEHANDPVVPMAAPGDGSTVDQVAALCRRLIEAARRSGEAALEARRQEAAEIVTGARQRAETETRAEIDRARTRLNREVERSLQVARLGARAVIAKTRWLELDSILSEAAAVVRQLPASDPARYTAALARLFSQTMERVSSPSAPDSSAILVRANPRDIPRLRAALARESAARTTVGVQFVDWDVESLFAVVSPDGCRLADESLAERLHCLDADLRLAAQEILFGPGQDD